MDQEARNKLQRATQQVRRILEEEFAEQLEGTFDILPDGKILPEAGKHLDARQRLSRQKLVDAIEHIKAGGKKAQEAVDEYTREAAFTFLNRFVALRMLEARDLLQECVSKGEQSSGFKEFCGLAPGLASLPDDGYRLYLECLFDELSVEVKVLFDRRDPASLLWPRRAALTELLNILGQADLAGVWSEDETIGWVYQYFNSGEERKKMREESQAPRNSRELAVRNQFFTPRYVVEFLTDNTLGRIWYEMRKGQTRLVDECRYLVRRPSEVFLNDGQEPPADDIDTEQDLTQEELLKKTVYVPHRPKKDPRDLKILDPACGSGHFLLYAFDLLITIYEEAWHDEASPAATEAPGPDGRSPAKRLREDYAECEHLHAALPSLVLRHNLHGIDIDPRAAQIAAIALWMRAQRQYRQYGVAASDRRRIKKTNAVVAEPMPGDKHLRLEFVSSLDKELGQLVDRVFTEMDLAGEAGSTLRIETAIQEAIREVYGETGSLFREADVERWERAEEALFAALRQYAERLGDEHTYRRHLFAEDTAQGFAFIDLCRQHYDVVLMNPPFGEFIDARFWYLDTNYKNTKRDLAMAFVDRGMELVRNTGLVGALHSRKPLFLGTQQPWRESLVESWSFAALADLGHRVLDTALVEVAATVIRPIGMPSLFIDCLDSADKERELAEVISSRMLSSRTFVWDLREFEALPSYQFAYSVPRHLLGIFTHFEALDSSLAYCKDGLSTRDNFRFLRLHWETSSDALSNGWSRLAKGGPYSPYYLDAELLLNWQDGKGELAAHGAALGNEARSRQGSIYYFQGGLTYTERTASRMSIRLLPIDAIFTTSGPGVLFANGADPAAVLGLLNSHLFCALQEVCIGGGDSVSSGSAARHYTPGGLGRMPVPSTEDLKQAGPWPSLDMATLQMVGAMETETSPIFRSRSVPFSAGQSLAEYAEARFRDFEERLLRLWDLSAEIETSSLKAYGLSTSTLSEVEPIVGPQPVFYMSDCVDITTFARLFELDEIGLINEVAARVGNARYVVVKSFVADRRYELIAHYFQCHPRTLVACRRQANLLPPGYTKEVAETLVSFAVGQVFGRWRSDTASEWKADQLLSEGYPTNPPALMSSHDDTAVHEGVLVDDIGHSRDFPALLKKKTGGSLDHACLLGQAVQYLAEGKQDARDWIAKSLFDVHVAKYTIHRRKAPVYWQLATPSASYSVWLYYHRFTKDTFFKILNEYVKPKLNHERQKLNRLRGEGGAEPTRSQRREVEDQEKFVAELAAMAEEVERIAPLWNPNLNDGVIINFAPLWRLVPQNKSWQKECKKCWDKLVAGDYDWAHLAMHLWPERVVPKCVTDASLAIAHGLEDTFWQQDDRDRFQPLEEPEGGWDPVIKELVEERTSPAVKAALNSLLEAPAPAGSTRTRRRRTAAT